MAASSLSNAATKLISTCPRFHCRGLPSTRLGMPRALEAECWLAATAAGRERFAVFGASIAGKANDRVRRSGFVKFGTDYAVPLDKNREMMAIYRRMLDQDAPGRYVIYGHIG